jgi:hypothetical protein
MNDLPHRWVGLGELSPAPIDPTMLVASAKDDATSDALVGDSMIDMLATLGTFSLQDRTWVLCRGKPKPPTYGMCDEYIGGSMLG